MCLLGYFHIARQNRKVAAVGALVEEVEDVCGVIAEDASVRGIVDILFCFVLKWLGKLIEGYRERFVSYRHVIEFRR